MSPQARTVLTLAEGRSSVPAWSFSTEGGRAMLRVGSGEHCNWRILAGGVQSNHLMFLWHDGKLSIIDVGAPDVRVDGVPLHGSRVVRSARIEFGNAAIVVESTGPAVELASEPALPIAGPTAKTIIAMEPRAPMPASLPTRIALPLPAPPDSSPGRRAPAPQVTRIGPVPAAPPTTERPAAVFQLPPEPSDTDAIATPTGGRSSLPARTWLLLCLTVAGAMLVFDMAGGDAATATATDPGPAAVEGAAPMAAAEPPDAGASKPIAEPLDAGTAAEAEAEAVARVEAAGETASGAPDESREVAATAGLDDPAHDPLATAHCRPRERRSRHRECKPYTPARVAADLVIAGRYPEALARYERLARLDPGDRSYGAMVEVLRQKIARRCDDSQEAPCNEP